MTIEIIKIDLDADLNGMSIARKQYQEVAGVRYYGGLERQAFRKSHLNGVGETVIDTEFSSKIDAWTGVSNFLTNRFNF